MDKTALIIVMMVLLVVLLILVFAYVYTRSAKRKSDMQAKKPAVQPQKVKKPRSFEELRSVIKNKRSAASELQEALDELLLHYGTIERKLGVRPHPDFDRYMEILFTICRHPNTNKDIVVSFDKRLAEKNPDYRREIDEALQRALSSRGM